MSKFLSVGIVIARLCLIAACGDAFAKPPIESVGAGGYITTPPPGAKLPPDEIYRTEHVTGPMPTNDWWSSLAWVKFSDKHYPHPLAVNAEPGGLRVYYPGSHITANKDAILAGMPGKGRADLVLGHSEVPEFPDARVDGFSDWFVSVRFGDADHGMTVSYGHGSPYVYALYAHGTPTLTFPDAPNIWAGGENSSVLGVSIGSNHYGLFGPSGSKWKGIGSATLSNDLCGKNYFSLAALPDPSVETLALFTRYAYAHVIDTKVAWEYVPATAAVTTRFDFTTHAYEGNAAGTLFAIYPHQWRHANAKLLPQEYDSVRGKMKLMEGSSFSTTMHFTGVLPALPALDGDRNRMKRYIDQIVQADNTSVRDTYGEGKYMGKLACALPIAQQYHLDAEGKVLLDRLTQRLEEWFRPAAAGEPKAKRVFYYDDRWGTLIGFPAGYGSDRELNDHHFHYGYFIRAAAEIARQNPKWASDERMGGMVKLLIRDIASADRKDPLFPFLRNFDPYAGHSWASGHARFSNGNNQESSSEAINAWYGIILWAEATGDKALRDLGVYLYTTEVAAINEYWFDVHGENFPKTYTPSVVTMVWGGKGANGTWFSSAPEAIHGINYLPITGGSLYLGIDPKYVEKNYSALLAERRGNSWKQWADIIWMYRALSNPADAMRQLEVAGEDFKVEDGNSRANTWQWIHALKELGEVDADVTGNMPLSAVFRKGSVRSHVAYNSGDAEQKVKFSDGSELSVAGHSFGVRK